MTRVCLLDVNVLVALFDPDHVHHDAAHDWFASNRSTGWATCPLTENGLVRILSSFGYSGTHEAPARIRGNLAAFCESGGHSFWNDDASIRDERFLDLSAVTHAQITDVYLLALATVHDGCLATFDRRIPLRAVPAADPDRLLVIRA